RERPADCRNRSPARAVHGGGRWRTWRVAAPWRRPARGSVVRDERSRPVAGGPPPGGGTPGPPAWRGPTPPPPPSLPPRPPRLAPEHGDDVWRLARALVPDDHPWFRLMPAREAVEIGPRAASKGYAVERFMAQPPFRDRCPVFVGDDFTDEAGMDKARDLGGL